MAAYFYWEGGKGRGLRGMEGREGNSPQSQGK